MIYLAEAHADDVWPMGYGIQQSKDIDHKQSNCDDFMKEWPELKESVDALLLDNMDNEFILRTGAWPEGYFITDEHGVV